MDRTIIHCDMNSFFASVELLSHPELVHLPTAVSGNPENRHGIILAKNEIAKSYGIVTAETIQSALRKCPDLNLLPPHYHLYKEYFYKINEIYYRYTDMIEPFSIDESWLDVTGSLKLFGSGKEIADSIRSAVKNELGLSLSAGVSFNKIFAKMGSEYKKPDATTLITKENFKNMLWKMDISEMFMIGKSTASKLRSVGILTIGDLAAAEASSIETLLGKHGKELHQYANGLDSSPVCQWGEKQTPKSVGNGMTFKKDLSSMSEVQTALRSLSDTVAFRLRKYCLKARGIKIDIKDTFFKSISRQKQLFAPTDITDEIYRTSLELFKASWNIKNPVRLITVTAINLTESCEYEQLSLFSQNEKIREKNAHIDEAIDAVRNKFGASLITYGNILNNDLGISIDNPRAGKLNKS